MSELYAIKSSILSSLGDAIRSKKGETKSFWSGKNTNPESTVEINIPIQLGSRYRFTYTVNTLNTTESSNNFTIYLGGYFLRSDYLMEGETVKVVFTADRTVDFIWIQVAVGKSFTCNWTLEGLDENDNVISHVYTPLEMVEEVNKLGSGGGGSGSDSKFYELVNRTITEFVDNDITTIGRYAFAGCNNLKTIKLPSLTEVNEYAFYNCGIIEEIDLSNVEHIYNNGMDGCSGAKYDVNYEIDFKVMPKLNLPKCRDVYNYGMRKVCFKTVSLPLLEYVNQYGFQNCNIGVLDLGPNLISITNYGLNQAYIMALVLRNGDSVVPLTSTTSISNAYFTNSKAIGYVYVPRELINAYIADSKWSVCSERFRALEDYTLDGTITGELDLIKIGIEEG